MHRLGFPRLRDWRPSAKKSRQITKSRNHEIKKSRKHEIGETLKQYTKSRALGKVAPSPATAATGWIARNARFTPYTPYSLSLFPSLLLFLRLPLWCCCCCCFLSGCPSCISNHCMAISTQPTPMLSLYSCHGCPV